MYPEEASSFSVLSIGHEHLQEHEAPLPPPSVATRRRGTAAGAAAAWGTPARPHTAPRSQRDGLTGRRQDETSGAEAESATTEAAWDAGCGLRLRRRESDLSRLKPPLASGSRRGEVGRGEGLLELLCVVEILSYP